MNIVEMRAGPKLDALIAGKVMGWRNATGPWIGGITPWATDTGYRRKAEFCPSTDIAAVATRDGMVSLRDDGWHKVIAGVTSIEEILRVVA